MSIGKLIDQNVYCTKCGAKGVGNCSCYERCSCGWWADAGEACGNPNTTACSTKLKYKVGPKKSAEPIRAIAVGKIDDLGLGLGKNKGRSK